MSNTPENIEKTLNKNKTTQTMRVIWTILIVAFGAIVLLRLYSWLNGQDDLRGLLSPLGMVFVGLGAIVRPHNRMLSYIFTGIALVLVITGLALMFIY